MSTHIKVIVPLFNNHGGMLVHACMITSIQPKHICICNEDTKMKDVFCHILKRSSNNTLNTLP